MKARERLDEFIEKNINREKDKWAVGSKSNYYEWLDLKNELQGDRDLRELYQEIVQEFSLREKYLKSTGQYEDFKEWRKKQDESKKDR